MVSSTSESIEKLSHYKHTSTLKMNKIRLAVVTFVICFSIPLLRYTYWRGLPLFKEWIRRLQERKAGEIDAATIIRKEKRRKELQKYLPEARIQPV